MQGQRGIGRTFGALGALVAMAAVIAACGSSSEPTTGTEQGELSKKPVCSYGGTTYPPGASFPSSDGCNVCGCAFGRVFCTKRACKAPDDAAAPPTLDAAVDDAAVPNDAGDDDAAIDAGAPDASVDDDAATPVDCNYNGATYPQGTSFPSDDGCNTCSCGPLGRVLCTKRACLIDAGATVDAAPPGSCDYGGVIHADGDAFPSTDGCNQCSCNGGSVFCTKRACRSP